MIRVHSNSIPRVLFYSPVVDLPPSEDAPASAELIVGLETSIGGVMQRPSDRVAVEHEIDANLVSSYVAKGRGVERYHDIHAPVLDIDIGRPADAIDAASTWFYPNAGISATRGDFYVVNSTTPGHFHLYVELAINWAQYQRFLHYMEMLKWMEPGYVRASIARGATFVRLPGHEKPLPDISEIEA